MKNKPTISVPIIVEQLATIGHHIFVTVKINGKRCRFLIDTGASHSVISKQYFEKTIGAKKLKTVKQSTNGLHSSTLESHFGKISKFELGILQTKNIVLAAIDLSHVNRVYGQLKKKKIQGIIGSDLLVQLKAVIDYGNAVLVLTPVP